MHLQHCPRSWKSNFVLVALCSALLLTPAQAAPKPAPIEVFADQVEVNLQTHSTHFKQNVRILFEPYQAHCQNADVILDATNQQVLRIIMEGNVVIQSGDSVLKGKRVILDVKAQRLHIEGQVYTRLQLERPINLNLH